MSAEPGTEAQSRPPPWAWLLLLSVPLIGLALLISRPELDLTWEHHPSHFWLVLSTAGVNVVLAYLTNEVANRRGDARLVLISLAFLASAGFLGLHALATPEVLLPSPNLGFVIATPVGLALASAFAAASISPIAGPRGLIVLRHRGVLRAALLALLLAWALISLARLPPLAGPLPPGEAVGPIAVLAAAAVALYVASAWRYGDLYRRRGSVLALAIVAALLLLAEAALAVLLSRNWRLSWWEWHLLMALAFAAIALGARTEYRRTGSITAAFGGIYLETTLARLDRWHARAIADLVAAYERGEGPDRLLADLRREGASADEATLLSNAALEMRRLDELFRPYLPAELAARLPHDPALAALGGEEREVSVLFADLAGFTTFSEAYPPGVVIDMLNSQWAAVVPVIEAAGGVIEHFAGDGVMVIFNAVAPQTDHAARAARAALEIVRATDPLAEAHAGWPRFRAGVNTGPAIVGNVGTAGRRTFGAIGDTANLGARLMSAGEPGQVVIGRATWDEVGGPGQDADVTSLGRITVKGKREPVEAWVLHGLARRE
ncbi:MAG: adenylate/guanylate cyclase domain-containing protein [Candidatus Limnocylindria bacterium]